MANRLPWFPHDHNARNDDFLQNAQDEFGDFGYKGYFMILEILHEHGNGDVLTMRTSRIARELRKKPKVIRNYLDFCQQSGKFEWTEHENVLRITVPKVRKKWANSKFKILSKDSQDTPKDCEDRDRDKERDRDINKAAKKPQMKGPKKRGPFNDFMDRYLKECLSQQPGVPDPTLRAAVSASYRRFGRAGRDIMAFAENDADVAWMGTQEIAMWLQSSNLSWTLDTIAKHFADWKANPGDFKCQK